MQLVRLDRLALLVLTVRMGLMVQRVRKVSKVSKASKALRVTRDPQALIQRLPDLQDRPDPLDHKGTLVRTAMTAPQAQTAPMVLRAQRGPQDQTRR